MVHFEQMMIVTGYHINTSMERIFDLHNALIKYWHCIMTYILNPNCPFLDFPFSMDKELVNCHECFSLKWSSGAKAPILWGLSIWEILCMLDGRSYFHWIATWQKKKGLHISNWAHDDEPQVLMRDGDRHVNLVIQKSDFTPSHDTRGSATLREQKGCEMPVSFRYGSHT